MRNLLASRKDRESEITHVTVKRVRSSEELNKLELLHLKDLWSFSNQHWVFSSEAKQKMFDIFAEYYTELMTTTSEEITTRIEERDGDQEWLKREIYALRLPDE